MRRRTDRRLFEVGAYEIAAGVWVAALGGVPLLIGAGTLVAIHGVYVCVRAAGIGEKSLPDAM